MSTNPYITPKLFTFLRTLEKNNNRAWFQENKERYTGTVRDPLLHFISDFGPHLAKISEHMVADPRPSGGSLFRIYRDTRFSKDKTPYKTIAGVHFKHEDAKDVHAPGFYLHLEPGGSFLGAGIWRPDTKTALRVRERIAESPAEWKKFRKGAFAKRFALEGESLKRPPRGFDPEHECIEDLKRKDFIVVTKLEKAMLESPRFLPEFTKLCRQASPFVSFVARALDLRY